MYIDKLKVRVVDNGHHKRVERRTLTAYSRGRRQEESKSAVSTNSKGGVGVNVG